MKWISSLMLAMLAVVAVAGDLATETMPEHLAVSAQLRPEPSKPGFYLVTSEITNLDDGKVIGKPMLLFADGSPAKIQMGKKDGQLIEIAVAANAASATAKYTFTLHRGEKLIHQQVFDLTLKN